MLVYKFYKAQYFAFSSKINSRQFDEFQSVIKDVYFMQDYAKKYTSAICTEHTLIYNSMCVLYLYAVSVGELFMWV